MRVRVIILVSVCLILTLGATSLDHTALAQEAGKQDPLDAKAEYLKGLAEAQKQYNEQAAAAHKRYLMHLADAQDRHTKAGNLDLSLKVRDEIEMLKSEGPPRLTAQPPGSTVSRAVVGTWKVLYQNSAVRTYQIKENADVIFVEDKRTGKLDKNFATLNFGDGKLEHLILSNGRLIVEHFNPGSDYPTKAPNVIGIGVRVGR
jgi:hypothetical protein